MENQKKLIESPLGGKAAPLMIPMVTSASVDQNEGTQVEVGAISTAKAVFDSTTDQRKAYPVDREGQIGAGDDRVDFRQSTNRSDGERRASEDGHGASSMQ